MRIQMRTLRKIIRESISEAHKDKLWDLFNSGKEGYRQAWVLWDTLDPGGCPMPDPEEWFGANDEPYIFQVFPATTMSMEDPYFFDEFCSAKWEEPYENLVFSFTFPFVCGDEDAEYDFGMGETYFVVPGTDRLEIKGFIEASMKAEIGYYTSSAPFWNEPVAIEADVGNQADIIELENGFATVYIAYQ